MSLGRPEALAPHRYLISSLATAFEPFVERLPVNTRGLHGDQHPLTFVFDQMRPEGLFEAPEALAGMRKFKLTTAHGCLRPQTCTVFGFAHIDSYEEEGGLVHILFTLIGVSSILLQSHGTYLLLG